MCGVVVYGHGKRKTPKRFVVACDKFIDTEVLRKDATPVADGRAVTQPPCASTQSAPTTPSATVGAVTSDAVTLGAPEPLEPSANPISQAIEQGADEAGWAFLGAVGNCLTKVAWDVSPRIHGCRKLSELLGKHPDRFESSHRGPTGFSSKVV